VAKVTMDNQQMKIKVDTNQNASERVKILLTEYEQVSNFIRHYNTMIWTIASIFLPFSWVSLYYAISIGKYYFPLAIGSIGLSVLWILIYERWNLYRRTGFKKLHELEKKLSLNFHHTVTAADKGVKQKIVSHKSIVKLNLILIIIAWLVLWLKI